MMVEKAAIDNHGIVRKPNISMTVFEQGTPRAQGSKLLGTQPATRSWWKTAMPQPMMASGNA